MYRKGLNNKNEVKITMYISWYLTLFLVWCSSFYCPLCSKVDGGVCLVKYGESSTSWALCQEEDVEGDGYLSSL